MKIDSEEFLFSQIFERDLHLTAERKEHIFIRHPEFRILSKEFQKTCHRPDFLIIGQMAFPIFFMLNIC